MSGSPCDFMPHFCFLSTVLSTQEAWRGPPLTVLSAAGWTWGPGPTSCVVQDVAFPSWNRQRPQGMGAVNARSYQSQAWPRPPPLPFTPLSALSKRLGGLSCHSLSPMEQAKAWPPRALSNLIPNPTLRSIIQYNPFFQMGKLRPQAWSNLPKVMTVLYVLKTTVLP